MCYFSIIIPTYNVEHYVKDCLDSILGQSFSDYEIIIVDDQSTDRTYDMIQVYANSESRIRLHAITHEGVGGARNRALSIAEGEYLVFVDADDKIDPYFLEKLHDCTMAQKADICYLPTYYMDTKTGKIKSELIKNLNKEFYYFDSINEFISFVISQDGIVPGSMWTQALKRDLVVKNKILFNPRYIWSEDCDFCFNALMRAERVAVCSYGGYIWNRTNAASSTTHISADKIISRLSVYCKWYQLYNRSQFDNISPENGFFLSQYFLRNYCEVLETYAFLKNNKERASVENVLEQQNILLDEPSFVPIEFKWFGLKLGRLLYLCRFYISAIAVRIRKYVHI